MKSREAGWRGPLGGQPGMPRSSKAQTNIHQMQMILKIVGRNCGGGIVSGFQNNFAGKLGRA